LVLWPLLAILFNIPPVTGVEFSADTYQVSPRGETVKGTIYSGQQRLRTESLTAQGEMVRIVDQNAGKQWVLYPGKREYAEESLTGLLAKARPGAEFSPCDGVEEARCEKLGLEQIAGRTAMKWRMLVEYQGAMRTLVQWIDEDRAIPLRSEMSNGRRMEMRMVGADTIDGRPVERWEMVMWGGVHQAPQRSYQWFDPELGLVIKEELPGGFVRELQNIRVAPQPAYLFRVPGDLENSRSSGAK
jgi:hypothetical protein